MVARVQDDALIVARAIQVTRGDTGGMHLALRFLPETWRHEVAHNDWFGLSYDSCHLRLGA